MFEWKRTGNKEYPDENQECLIYFYHTGYSKSVFNWSRFIDGEGNAVEDLGKMACFSDEGGYLSDDDVLWMPWNNSFLEKTNLPSIPETYKNDKSFKRWDDPEKAYKHVILVDDFHYIRNPEKISGINHWELDIPKNSKLRVISSEPWKNDGTLGQGEYVHQCVYDDGSDLHIVYISPDKVRDMK